MSDLRVPSVAKRKSAPRSRNGCDTCKRRRVRCDELQPRCNPCQKSSRVCDFSAAPFRPSPEQLKIILWQLNKPKMSSPASDPVRTAAQAQAFAYFHTTLANKLGGFFEFGFCSRLVEQCALQDSSIAHAIVALASISEGFPENDRTTNKELSTCNEVALKQYNKAVSTLKHNMDIGRPPIEAILTACVLFVCFEMLQNNHESALRQMCSGAYIFHEWHARQKTGYSLGSISKEECRTELHCYLRIIFLRVLLQLLVFPDTSRLDWRLMRHEFTPPQPDIPQIFISIGHARACLDTIMTFIFHGALTARLEKSSIGMPDQPQIGPESGIDLLPFHQWSLAFQTFCTDKGTILSEKDQLATMVLEIQQLTGMILASAGAFRNEMAFDQHEPDFAKLLVLVSQVEKTRTTHDLTSPTFDMGILAPLYLTATRCRHPRYRREALYLLGRSQRQEGLWHSRMLFRIAERIMTVEEVGIVGVTTSADIQAGSRIALSGATIDSTKQVVKLRMSRQQFRVPGQGEIFECTVEY